MKKQDNSNKLSYMLATIIVIIITVINWNLSGEFKDGVLAKFALTIPFFIILWVFVWAIIKVGMKWMKVRNKLYIAYIIQCFFGTVMLACGELLILSIDNLSEETELLLWAIVMLNMILACIMMYIANRIEMNQKSEKYHWKKEEVN